MLSEAAAEAFYLVRNWVYNNRHSSYVNDIRWTGSQVGYIRGIWS